MPCGENCSSYCSTRENAAKMTLNEAWKLLKGMAGTTGLEPATSDVTGRRSNQTELRPRNVRGTFDASTARVSGQN